MTIPKKLYDFNLRGRGLAIDVNGTATQDNIAVVFDAVCIDGKEVGLTSLDVTALEHLDTIAGATLTTVGEVIALPETDEEEGGGGGGGGGGVTCAYPLDITLEELAGVGLTRSVMSNDDQTAMMALVEDGSMTQTVSTVGGLLDASAPVITLTGKVIALEYVIHHANLTGTGSAYRMEFGFLNPAGFSTVMLTDVNSDKPYEEDPQRNSIQSDNFNVNSGFFLYDTLVPIARIGLYLDTDNQQYGCIYKLTDGTEVDSGWGYAGLPAAVVPWNFLVANSGSTVENAGKTFGYTLVTSDMQLNYPAGTEDLCGNVL